MKKRILSILAIFTMLSTIVNAEIPKKDGKYFIFDGPKQVEFDTKDIKFIADNLKLEDSSGEEYEAVVNIIGDNKLAISPIKKAKGQVKIKDLNNYNVKNYDKNIYIQNKRNIERISKALAPDYPIYYPLEGAGQRDMAVEDVAPQAKNSSEIKSESGSSKDYSKTNVQTKGVDEADIVKTDGKYIYFVKGTDLVIVDANTKSMKVLATIKGDYKKVLKDIYIDKNRLSVIYSSYEIYRSSYSGEKTVTILENYDTTDIKNPKKISEKSVLGHIQDSRKIGDTIYLITNDYFRYIYEEPTLYKKMVIPNYPREPKLDLDGINLEKMLYLPFNPAMQSTNITAISTGKDAKSSELLYMGESGNVYMSNDNIYISTLIYGYDYKTREYLDNTNIKKFSVNKMDFKYIGQNDIKGNIINQFALNEKDGNLFVAYTTFGFGEEKTNAIASFDKNMKKISELGGLAKDEKIYSARFMGDKGYLVTFKEVDPLFVIDLKNPKDMKVLGYLKIPGYSDYLHPYKDNYLIGFGQRTAINQYDDLVNDGFKMSLFDVSDFANPKEIDVQNIGARGTYSDIQNDHKSLMFDENRDIFAFPISVNKAQTKVYNGEKLDTSYTSFVGAYVYSVSPKGFKIKGRVSHYDNNYKEQIDYDIYDYNRRIQRIVQIGNNIYTLSEYGIKVNDINTMKELGELKF